jgi:flagellar hook-associated protein 3
MRVSMPTIFGNIQSQLQRLAEDLQHTNMTISTGRKYQQISDNPVEVGALMGLNLESAQATQYKSNLDTANSWLSSTETALTNINTLVSSTAGLAEQMATGTYTASQRAAAAQQVEQYLEEIMQMGNARYQGHYILSGYKIDTEPFVQDSFTAQVQNMVLQPGSGGSADAQLVNYNGSGGTYMVEIVSGGDVGTATYRVSQDGGDTWSATATTSGDEEIDTGVHALFAGSNWVE